MSLKRERKEKLGGRERESVRGLTRSRKNVVACVS